MENNMVNGLSISEDEFIHLKQKEQNLILFRNINDIKKVMIGYKIYYKITAMVGSVLAVGMGILFKMQVGR